MNWHAFNHQLNHPLGWQTLQKSECALAREVLFALGVKQRILTKVISVFKHLGKSL